MYAIYIATMMTNIKYYNNIYDLCRYYDRTIIIIILGEFYGNAGEGEQRINRYVVPIV